jgi:hypothetical protein
MQARQNRRDSFQRRASVVVYTTVSLTAMVGMAALAVDVSMMYTAKAELQRAADAAALAAAAELVNSDPDEREALALQVAEAYAAENPVLGAGAGLDSPGDVEFGKAVYDEYSGRFAFDPGGEPTDAVRVTVKRPSGGDAGPIQFAFARIFGYDTKDMQARAAAVLVPRDIAVVIDLSGSMNDDSELRHYRPYTGDSGDPRDAVAVNIYDIWTALPIEKGNAGVGNGIDPPPPGNPNSENDHPGTGPGAPGNAGGNPDPGADPDVRGPRWGWMTGWGVNQNDADYSPADDPGLYYIPRYEPCTDPDVIENLATAGYSAQEQAALLSDTYDYSYTYYRNRVRVLLGLSGWKSKKPGGKYTGGPGNGNDTIDDNELWQNVSYPFSSGSWTDYVNYVYSSSTRMAQTDPQLRYRYGIKTAVNYLLEKRPKYSQTEYLFDTPEQPLQAVKDAVQAMTDVIVGLESLDHVSLEVFATTANHELDLSDDLQSLPDHLNEMQAGHYDTTTNLGGGIGQAINELTGERARSGAAKVIVVMSDGKPNIDRYGNYVGDGDPEVREYCLEQAQVAVDGTMRIYSISVGYDVDQELMAEIAALGRGEHFHAEGTPEEYADQLEAIFETLGGKRPVALIE